MSNKSDLGRVLGDHITPSMGPGLPSYAEEFFGPAEEIDELQRDLEDARSEISRLKKELEVAVQHSVMDPLTGLTNRRGLDMRFSAMINAFKRSMRGIDEHRKAPNVVALMIDIDHFKSINDHYGHSLGDKMLIIVSNLMREYFGHRQGEILGRWGGEEFLIILPQSSTQYAYRQAELFRSAVERTIVHLTSREKLSVTVSIGLAEAEIADLHRTSEDILAELINKADGFLYKAKNEGRNRVQTE